MQSKTSCFNSTLFRKNLSRFWPLWGFASFLGFLVPAALLVQYLQYGKPELQALEIRQAYYYILTAPVPIISLLYAILCAMCVWSYLYQARSVGLMHTLPIRREGLFLTNLLSGLSMMLIPYAVTGILCTLLFLCCGSFDLLGTVATIGGVLGISVLFFGIATFCAFLTGHLIALPVLYFLLNFLAPLLDWLVNLFAQGFLFGFTRDYSGTVEWLSPVIYLCNHLEVDSAGETISYQGVDYEYVLTDVTLESGWLIAVYAAVGVVLLLGAWLLYRRRQSERAGDVVAVRAFRPVFRFGAAGLCALLGGWLLYALLWQAFQTGDEFDTIPMAIAMILAGLIGYYAASMLLSKSLRVFRGSAVGALCLAVSCAAFCAGMDFDIFGRERRVPESDEITCLTLYIADNTYYLEPGEDELLLQGARELQRTLIDQQNDIRQESEWAVESGTDWAYTRIYYTYTLKNGSTVVRNYRFHFLESALSREGSYAQQMDAFVNSAEMRQARLRWNDPDYEVESGYFYSYVSGEGYSLGSRECETLLAAIAADAADGAWGRYDWFSSDEDMYAMDLNFDFQMTLSGETTRSWDSISILLRPGMEATKQALIDLELAGERDFVTYGQYWGEEDTDLPETEEGVVYTTYPDVSA